MKKRYTDVMNAIIEEDEINNGKIDKPYYDFILEDMMDEFMAK